MAALAPRRRRWPALGLALLAALMLALAPAAGGAAAAHAAHAATMTSDAAVADDCHGAGLGAAAPEHPAQPTPPPARADLPCCCAIGCTMLPAALPHAAEAGSPMLGRAGASSSPARPLAGRILAPAPPPPRSAVPA